MLGGVTTRRGYNELGEVSGDSAWANGVLIFARTYTRDDLGRITSVEDFADGVTTLWEYGYDAAGRLETVTRDGAAYASYAYDANGNRLSRTSPSGVETGTYDAQDRLLEYGGATYSYTANGELTEKVEGADTTRYAYDVFGNLTRVDLPDGTVIEYVIDGRNRRVGKKVDGVLVQGFLYGDQLNPVAELDGAGNVVSRFIYGSTANVPDYVVRGGETFRVLSDHLGSVRMVVNVATGAVVQRLSYDAWGRVLEDTNPGWQPFGFAGGVWEAGTGLVRFGARDYSVEIGRWIAKDMLGFGAGSSNLFAYVQANPVLAPDPSGLCPSQGEGTECQQLARRAAQVAGSTFGPAAFARSVAEEVGGVTGPRDMWRGGENVIQAERGGYRTEYGGNTRGQARHFAATLWTWQAAGALASKAFWWLNERPGRPGGSEQDHNLSLAALRMMRDLGAQPGGFASGGGNQLTSENVLAYILDRICQR